MHSGTKDRRTSAANRRVFLASLFILSLAPCAEAYIDPGSGALVLQALISALIGGLFFARRFLARMSLGLTRLFKGQPSDSGPGTSPPAL